MFNVAQQWNRCLDVIKANLPAEQFDVWFAPIVAVDFDQENNRVTLRVPSQFYIEKLEDRYLSDRLRWQLWTLRRDDWRRGQGQE